jgi:hypothetical protein
MNGADGQALPRLSASDYFVQTWGVLVAAYRELNARKPRHNPEDAAALACRSPQTCF